MPRRMKSSRKTFARIPLSKHFFVSATDAAVVVALARQNVQARTPHANFNRMKVVTLVYSVRFERKRILIARFFGNVGVEPLEIGCFAA